MQSERLMYKPVEPALLDDFHRLVRDDYVRRYLLDGEVLPREWSLERIEESRVLFERRGVGLWLACDNASGELAGFCGFLEIPSVHPEPQLVYAVLEAFAGRGYGTEMARAATARARGAGFREIIASVDEVNTASLCILEKLGFERTQSREGCFGPLLLLRLAGSAR